MINIRIGLAAVVSLAFTKLVNAGHQCGPTQMEVWYGAQATTLKSHTQVCETWRPLMVGRHGPGWDNFAYFELVNEGHSVVCYWQNNEYYGGDIQHLNTGGGTRCITAPRPEKCGESSGNSVGNPCNVSNGNKVQTETDFQEGRLPFTRTYNSKLSIYSGTMGQGWSHSYQQSLKLSSDGTFLTTFSAAGTGERWDKVGDVWRGPADTDVQLVQQIEAPFNFIVTRSNRTVETYDVEGKLLSIVKPNGNSNNYEYDASTGLLTSVFNSYGDQLVFSYIEGRLVSVLNSLGHLYRYEYDVFDNLSAVVFPDETEANALDNPRREYHYENIRYPYRLTGITDENGDRYATYAYDVSGKAISTEHAPTTNTVGQEKFELNYQ